jgi:hypothetical protein
VVRPLPLMQGQQQPDCQAKHSRNENAPQPNCAQEQGDAGSQQRTQKHGNAKNDAQLQIHDTAPNAGSNRAWRRQLNTL